MTKLAKVTPIPVTYKGPAPGSRLWCLFGVHGYEIVCSGPYEVKVAGRVIKRCRFYDLRCRVCGKMTKRIL